MATRRSQEEEHYWANGVRVELHPSTDFIAVKTGNDAASAASTAMGTSPSDGMAIPDRNLVLVPVGAGVGATGAEGARARAANGTAGTTAVYESADAQGVYLIPVGEVIVKFREGTSESAIKRHLSDQGATVMKTDYPEPGAFLVTVSADDGGLSAANALHDDATVEYAEPNFVQVTSRPGPATSVSVLDAPAELNLPRYEVDDRSSASSLAGVMAPDPSLGSQWGLTKIRAIDAWAISAGDPNVSIAVIDEGVDIAHEDLSLKLPGYDAYQGDNNPQPTGNDAHGTACAGIVSAIRNNGRGGAGVAPNCRVLPIRIAKGIGGGFWDTDSAKVADGIRTAVNRGADVLSNSYSVSPSSAVTNAFTYAATSGRGGKGCAMAAATGNQDIAGVIYPASLSPTVRGMMAVGASNEWDQRKSKTSLDGENWWGSNHGPEVDIVAPGVHIFTTDIMGGAGYAGGNYVPGFNGTSSATPHVAGVMGLVLSVDRDLRGWEVEDILKLTATDLGVAGRDNFTGYGRVDARRALEAASRLWYVITPTVEFIGGRAFMRVNARLYNSGINTVRLDSFTLTSHSPDWSTEIDRFEYRPNPGNVMLPRAGQDVRLNRLLLTANGTTASWSYRWAANWTYTFWRPGAPGFPLSSSIDSLDAAMSGPATTVNGSAKDRGDSTASATPVPTDDLSMPSPGAGMDVPVTLQSGQSITITIR